MRGTISLIALLACLLAFGCKQGEGERCQVKEDCEGDLTCTGPTGAKTCERVGGGGDTVDAAPVDAQPNVDAGPTPDASSIDAALPDATASLAAS